MFLFLAMSSLWLGPGLACGSFAPRPTPTPPSITQAADAAAPTAVGDGSAPADSTPIPIIATNTPLPVATPTFTPTTVPGTALAAGQPARVTAPNGLNMRNLPSTNGTLLVRLGTGQKIDITDGPTTADGFTWWELDDGQGTVGWAAEGDGDTEWLSPRIGEPQPVNRTPRVGDRVIVTTELGQQLTIRALPGVDAPLVTRVDNGAQFTIQAGPQSAAGFTWFQIRNDSGTLEGWAADGDGTTRWLSPLE